MKKTIFPLMLILVLIVTTSCNKENNNDLTQEVVGRYTNPNESNLEIIVNKIDNSTVSITIQDDYEDYAFTNVTMDSKNSFTLNSYTRNSNCFVDGQGDLPAILTISGSGTASSNNISIFIEEETVAISDNCTELWNGVYSASK